MDGQPGGKSKLLLNIMEIAVGIWYRVLLEIDDVLTAGRREESICLGVRRRRPWIQDGVKAIFLLLNGSL